MTLFQGGRLLWLVFENMKVPHTYFEKSKFPSPFRLTQYEKKFSPALMRLAISTASSNKQGLIYR